MIRILSFRLWAAVALLIAVFLPLLVGQQIPSPWYLQDVKTSTITDNNTDILSTTQNGTHIFVMGADSYLHLFSYSAAGGNTTSVGFAGKFAINSVVTQNISSGLNWRTTSAFSLVWNNYTNELYAIKVINLTVAQLQVYILDSTNFSSTNVATTNMFSVYKNPRLSTAFWAPYFLIGIFYDPAFNGDTGNDGFWLARYSYAAGSLANKASSSGGTHVFAIQYSCGSSSSMCLWTSQNSFDEYAMLGLSYIQSRVVTSTPVNYDPSIAMNSTGSPSAVAYYFHRSFDLIGNPFVLYKKNATIDELSSVVLPYQINFDSTIPEYDVRTGANSDLFVGFTTNLNGSLSYGDHEVVVGHLDSNTMELQGHMFASTVGKDNFADIIPLGNNGFVVVGRSDGNLTKPQSLSGIQQIFVMQFEPLRVKSLLSSVPMQVYPNETIRVQFESTPAFLTVTPPTVKFNSELCSSVSWVDQNTLSARIPGNISVPGDLWVSFDSDYKESVRIPGILVNVTGPPLFSLISVYPAIGPTVGFNLTLITSYIDEGLGPIVISIGGKLCGAPLQLNTTAFRCTVAPGTGRNKLVNISVNTNSTSGLVYVSYNPPAVAAVSSSSSLSSSGRVIYIAGSGFGYCSSTLPPCNATAENISVLVASIPCNTSELQSDGAIICETSVLAGQNISLQVTVDGQNTSTMFSYDPPRISTVIPSWMSSSNPTIYLEGANFGPAIVNRSLILGRYSTNQTYICPSLTWISHTSLKCQFTNISLPLDSRFSITLYVEGQPNPDSNITEFRTGLMNVPPIIYPLHEFVNEDESVFLTISSSVQHFVFANPQSGSLYQVTTSGTKGNLIDASFTPVSTSHPQARILYIPRQNYFGNDSFQVQAIDDKGGKSGVESIQITIASLPDPPVPQSMEIYLDEDTSAVVDFNVDDPDQTSTSNFTITILALPRSGSLFLINSSSNASGSNELMEITNVPFTLPSNVTSAVYRPFKDENGFPYATLHFKANDGELDSVINGTIILNVRPINDLPTFNRSSLNMTIYEDSSAKLSFNISDVDKNDIISVKIHNLRIDGTLFLANVDSEQTGPLGEGSDVLGPPFEIVYVPRRDFYTSNTSGLQRFNITYVDREGGFSDEISFDVLPVNDPPKLTCGNPNIIELSTEFVTNSTAAIGIRVIATDVDDTELTYHLAALPQKGHLISSGSNNVLELGGTFSSPDLVYRFNAEGGMYPFVNFSVFVEDSHKATSKNCTYILSFKCPAGKVNNIFSRNMGPICVECPEGAVCSMDGSSFVQSKVGWWRSEDNSTFLPCFPMKACSGNLSHPCSEGYEGTRCGRCTQGFYRFTNGCYKCGEETYRFQLSILALIAVTVCVGSFFVFKLSGSVKGPVFGLFSILVNFIQTILLLRQMRLNWPEKLLELLSWLSLINFNVELAGPECLAQNQSFDFSFKMKLSLAIPLLITILALIFGGSVKLSQLLIKTDLIGAASVLRNRSGVLWTQIVQAWMSLLNLLFVYVATNSVALFDCTLEPDNMSYLDADPSLRCYETWYYQDLPFSILGICFYVIGIPVQSLVVSLAADRARKSLSNHEFLRAFQLFCQRLMDSRHEYKVEYQFLNVIQLFQRLIMVIVTVFFTRYSGLQVVLTQFVLLSNVIMLLRYQPYEFQILNRFDTFSNVSSMIVLGFGMPFHMDNFDPVLQTALMVFILILNCSVIVVGSGRFSLECYKYFGLIKSNIRSSKMEKLASKPNSSNVMVGKCDPSLET